MRSPNESGLPAAEAARRLERDGPNAFPIPRGPSHVRAFLAQLTNLFALLLWAAVVLATLAHMPELAVAIACVVLLNGAVAFAQELRAEHAARRLHALVPRRATVVRDGRPVQVDAREVVRGDLVRLAEGDRIAADLDLVSVATLAVDTSVLTGEAIPSRPEVGHRLFAGTFVVEGEAEGVVIATGPRTRIAAITALTSKQTHAPTPVARELARLVRWIAAIAGGVGILLFGVGLVVGLTPAEGFLFGLGVTVALVPEGMLPTVTLALALAARRMASRNALVRRLDAVETLGATTFICTDKTGTLTRNEMAVVGAWCPAGEVRLEAAGYDPRAGAVPLPERAASGLRVLARAAARASNGRATFDGSRWVAAGDPMEAALDVFARRVGVDLDADERSAPTVRKFAFDPRRRRMSVVAGGELLVKGAPEAVFARCVDVAADAHDRVASYTARGFRVLAVASRRERPPDHARAEDAERHLSLLGLVALEDPPRDGAAAALATCRRAGVKVAMITGDHPGTAVALAREVGLAGPRPDVLRGDELPAEDELLGARLDRDGVVVCRVSPEDKLRIARALQARGHVLAMTGDGVNDAPALERADVGVAMGRSGTDVAREAADLVLLDDDFGTIVVAIAHGRAAFSNLERVLTYHVTDNVAELAPFVLWALSGGRFPLALSVLQILCLDLVTDQLPALALGSEPPAGDDPGPKPVARIVDGHLLFRALCVLGPAEAVVEMTAYASVLGWGKAVGAAPATVAASASGAAFLAVVIGQAANALACRSATAPVWRLGSPPRPLVGAIAFAFSIYALLVAVTPLAHMLRHAPPAIVGLAVALLAAPAVVLADAAEKALRPRRVDI